MAIRRGWHRRQPARQQNWCDWRRDDRAGRNALDALHSYADADGIHKKHDALDGRPVKRIGIFCKHGVNEQRRPDDEDIEREEHEHESGRSMDY